MSVLGTIDGEGFLSIITEEVDGRVHFLADADIDADGANGQNSASAAYKVDNSGTELLANGGMKILAGTGKVICAFSWAREIVLLGSDRGNINSRDAGKQRLLRGASWNNGAWTCRSANRNFSGVSNRYINFGLRVVAVTPRTS